jgi:hypothetical protein
LTPTIRQIPAMPAMTPKSFLGVVVSCRVTSAVNRKVKIGAAELRMVARPASTDRSPQAISVQGMTLLRQAWTAKRRQVAASVGIVTPRQRMTRSSSTPAIRVRHAIRVIGGIVATPSLMKL